MISQILKRHYDKTKQFQFGIVTEPYTDRMRFTIWVLLARFFHYSKASNDSNSLVSAVAKTSRKAQLSNSKDGGTQGYMRELKALGLPVLTDRKSILKAEYIMEELGLITFTRAGFSRVAIAHMNARACALYLEAYHPDLEWLQDITGKHFNWIKPLCDDILGRDFNRLGEDSYCFDGHNLDQDIETFDRDYPTVIVHLETLPEMIQAMFTRFCSPKNAHLQDCCVYWDVNYQIPA